MLVCTFFSVAQKVKDYLINGLLMSKQEAKHNLLKVAIQKGRISFRAGTVNYISSLVIYWLYWLLNQKRTQKMT